MAAGVLWHPDVPHTRVFSRFRKARDAQRVRVNHARAGGSFCRPSEMERAGEGRQCRGTPPRTHAVSHAGASIARAVFRCRAKTRYERLSSMAFWSIWSAVVTTLLLDWKPRWVIIMFTISVAMSTLDSSIL